MPQTTPLQAFTIPSTGDNPAIPSDMLAQISAVEKRIVMRFDTSSQRDSVILVPESGMLAWLRTPKIMTLHDGVSWVNLNSLMLSPVIAAVDAVNSGGQITLTGAGSNKAWMVKSKTNTLAVTYDSAGTPVDVATFSATGLTLPTTTLFTRAGVLQPVLRSGTGVPSNATGVDGDWFLSYA